MAEVSVNEVFIIRGVQILEGKYGLFVRTPQHKARNQRWYDQVMFTDVDDFEQFTRIVLEAYIRACYSGRSI